MMVLVLIWRDWCSKTSTLSSDLWHLLISFEPPMSMLQGIDQEVLDQAWRDSVPGKRSCQFLDLNNLNCWFGENPSASIARSLCIAKLIKKRCLSALIDVKAENGGSAPAVYTSQCIRRHYVLIGTMITGSFAVLHAIDHLKGGIATMLQLAEGRNLEPND